MAEIERRAAVQRGPAKAVLFEDEVSRRAAGVACQDFPHPAAPGAKVQAITSPQEPGATDFFFFGQVSGQRRRAGGGQIERPEPEVNLQRHRRFLTGIARACNVAGSAGR
jgi:hypothetical protein